jgi:hypothetical protein
MRGYGELPAEVAGSTALVRFGVVEAINGNIRKLINRGRSYKDMRCLLLKARRAAVTNTEYAAFRKSGKPSKMPLFRILAEEKFVKDREKTFAERKARRSMSAIDQRRSVAPAATPNHPEELMNPDEVVVHVVIASEARRFSAFFENAFGEPGKAAVLHPYGGIPALLVDAC